MKLLVNDAIELRQVNPYLDSLVNQVDLLNLLVTFQDSTIQDQKQSLELYDSLESYLNDKIIHQDLVIKRKDKSLRRERLIRNIAILGLIVTALLK